MGPENPRDLHLPALQLHLPPLPITHVLQPRGIHTGPTAANLLSASVVPSAWTSAPSEPHLVGSFPLSHYRPPHLNPGHSPTTLSCFLVLWFPFPVPTSPEKQLLQEELYTLLSAHTQFYSPGHTRWPLSVLGLIKAPQAHLVPEDQGHHATSELDYEANPKDVHKLKNKIQSLRGAERSSTIRGIICGSSYCSWAWHPFLL